MRQMQTALAAFVEVIYFILPLLSFTGQTEDAEFV
jgi:hypothetical protein